MSTANHTGLELLAFLIGPWSGQGKGFGHTSDVEHTYQFVLQDRFIHSQTKSISHEEDGSGFLTTVSGYLSTPFVNLSRH